MANFPVVEVLQRRPSFGTPVWVVAAAIVLFASIGQAQPRIAGMAGAQAVTANGVDAIFANPSLLAMPGQKRFELHLFGLNAMLYNSSLSLDFYHRYNGDSLDTDEKKDIVSRFPDDGWKIGGRIQVPALGLRIGRVGFAAAVCFDGQIALPKELLKRPFYGIEMNRTYSLGPFTGSAIAYGRYTLAYAHPFSVRHFDSFAAGIGLSFLHGFAHGEILEGDGYFKNDYQSEIEWRLRTRTGLWGTGFGLDLGAAAKRGSLSFGIALSNLASRISWKSHTEEQLVWLRADSMNVARFDTVDADDVFDKGDSTYSVGTFSTALPTRLMLGVAYHWRKLLLAFDYHQAFRSRYTESTTPELALGVESRYVGFLPLRFGFALGGGKGFRPSFGFGLHVLGLRWDLAVGGVGSFLPSHMRGLQLATSLRIAH